MPSLRTAAIGAVVALGAVATAVVLVDRGAVPPLLDTSGCTAEVDGHTVEVDLEQAENAALITAVAVERGMPARAASIALKSPSGSTKAPGTIATSACGTSEISEVEFPPDVST